MRLWQSFIIIIVLFLANCSRKESDTKQKTRQLDPPKTISNISKEVYHDKLLGLLLGSAIGDAMGAPTEMWNRQDMKLDYGFVESLDSMIRNPSPEGTWKYNLPAGGTTDDTRWKKLTVQFLLENNLNASDPESFAGYIVREYQDRIQQLKDTEGFEPEPYEENLMKMTWLQQWAMVAKPFSDNNLKAYSRALNKFYGGEMSCAGMLYSPVIGAIFPGNALDAYQAAFEMSIFDIGYSRDMTALISAMTAACFDENTTQKSVLNVNRTIDPEGYFKSRLVGRSAYRFYQYALRIKFETDAIELTDNDVLPIIPNSMRHLDTLEYLKMRKAFEMLDQANEDVAFHPGEIYLITLSAMMFCDFDFEKTLSFITNYGRDNDTVAAIAGAILGAYWGAEKLPKKMKGQVISVNKTELGIDLEQLAKQLTDQMFK